MAMARLLEYGLCIVCLLDECGCCLVLFSLPLRRGPDIGHQP